MVDDCDIIANQPIFGGEVPEFRSIVTEEASTPPHPKPQITTEATFYCSDSGKRQSSPDAEVLEFSTIVTRGAAICGKPHNSIRISVDGMNPVTC